MSSSAPSSFPALTDSGAGSVLTSGSGSGVGVIYESISIHVSGVYIRKPLLVPVSSSAPSSSPASFDSWSSWVPPLLLLKALRPNKMDCGAPMTANNTHFQVAAGLLRFVMGKLLNRLVVVIRIFEW
jgi:hypothetical protein